MKRFWQALCLLALSAPLAASGWSDLDVGLYGLLGRVLGPDSMNTCHSVGGGVDLDYRLGRLAGVDVALGLNEQLASFSNDSATSQALSSGLNLRFSLPWGRNQNPYLGLKAGYCPLAGTHSTDWDGHYQAGVSLGNRGWFSDNCGLDTALMYDAYSPQDKPLQNLGVRLGLLLRLEPPATMDASKASPPELTEQEKQEAAQQEKDKIAAPKGAPMVKGAAMPAAEARSGSEDAGDHP